MEEIQNSIENKYDRKCINCGKSLQKDQKFCPYCGTDNSTTPDKDYAECNSVADQDNTGNLICEKDVQGETETEELTKNEPFYTKPIFAITITIIVILIIVVSCIVSEKDVYLEENYGEQIVTEESSEIDVEEVVNQVLQMKNAEIEDMKWLYTENKKYMTEEQKEQCLNQYRKWAIYNYTVNDLRERMKNPKSFEVESGSVNFLSETDGEFSLFVEITYYGTNSFGGTLRETSNALVTFTASDDDMELLHVDPIIYY